MYRIRAVGMETGCQQPQSWNRDLPGPCLEGEEPSSEPPQPVCPGGATQDHQPGHTGQNGNLTLPKQRQPAVTLLAEQEIQVLLDPTVG